MRTALGVKAPGASSATTMGVPEVQRLLRDWSVLIRDKFTADNAHLTVPRGCAAGGNIGEALAAIQRSLSTSAARTEARFSHLSARIDAVAQAVSALRSSAPPPPAVAQSPATSPARTPSSASGRASKIASPPSTASVTVALAAAAAATAGAIPVAELPADVEPAAARAAALSSLDGHAGSRLGALGNLRGPLEPRKLAGILAVPAMSYYYLHGQHESGYSPQDMLRLKEVTMAFNAMASPEELASLRPSGRTASGTVAVDAVSRGDLERRTILDNLDELLRKRFYVLLAEAGVVKPQLLSGKRLLVSAVSDRISEINSARSKAQLPPLTSSRSIAEAELRADFRAWRQAGASTEVAPVAAAVSVASDATSSSASRAKPPHVIADAAATSVAGAAVATAAEGAQVHAGMKRGRSDDSSKQAQAPAAADSVPAPTSAASGAAVGRPGPGASSTGVLNWLASGFKRA